MFQATGVFFACCRDALSDMMDGSQTGLGILALALQNVDASVMFDEQDCFPVWH